MFGWLREARKSPVASRKFVPVVIEPMEAPPVVVTPKRRRKRSAQGGIEVEIDGVTVRIERGAETRTVAAVNPGSGPSAGVMVLVATRPVDFCGGIDGLARAVKEELRTDPSSGVVYVFRAKRVDRINCCTGMDLAWCSTPSAWSKAASSGRRSPTGRCG